MDFGHTGVVRALLAADPAAQPLADDLLAALGAKDRAALRVLAAQLAPATARALDVLVTLHGAPAAVLAQAREQLPAMPAIARALDDLAELTAAVVADAVSIDLSDLHGYRYYTGVNFAAYSRTAGLQGAVLRGGRYDDIGRAFGRARAATGFSIDLRELARAHVAVEAEAVLAPAGQDAALRAKVAELRAAGEVVVQQLDASDVPETFEFARELKLVNGRWCVQPRGR
jgi:ATP phosphoribosyltransferase regulatory subunit